MDEQAHSMLGAGTDAEITVAPELSTAARTASFDCNSSTAVRSRRCRPPALTAESPWMRAAEGRGRKLPAQLAQRARPSGCAFGYAHQPNAAALVLGPTGLAYDTAADVLYVASTADNAIFAVPHAGGSATLVNKGTPVFANPVLRGPLGLVFAPDGNLLTSNGDAVNGDPTHPSEIIEFTKSGQFVRQFNVDASQGGAFGIATVLSGSPQFNFAAVDDVPNVISVYQLLSDFNASD